MQFYILGHQVPLKDNDPNGSKYPGFKSGIAKDGSTLYVGSGSYAECDGENPARISNDEKGAYSFCKDQQRFDNKEAKYFINHSKMRWTPTNATSYKRVAGALLAFQTGTGQNYFGRVALTNERGRTFYQIGTIADNKICYWQDENVCETGNFDVLTCTR